MLAAVEDSGCSIRSQISPWYLLRIRVSNGYVCCLVSVPPNTVVTKYIRDVLLHVLALSLHLLRNVRHYRFSPCCLHSPHTSYRQHEEEIWFIFVFTAGLHQRVWQTPELQIILECEDTHFLVYMKLPWLSNELLEIFTNCHFYLSCSVEIQDGVEWSWMSEE